MREGDGWLYCRMRWIVAVIAIAVMGQAGIEAQRRSPARKPAQPAAPALKKEPARVTCPEPLGRGVKTGGSFCFVLAGMDPEQGVRVAIPPHAGPATLTFLLHNRHTYSEEDMSRGRRFGRYMAIVGVLTMGGDLLGRGAVASEFRGADDLYDRVGGGAGPTGLKAVAPIGAERVYVTIPPEVTEVSILGETIDAMTAAGRETTARPGSPVAILSDVAVEYRPAPARRR